MAFGILIVSIVILFCVLLNRLSQRIGIPMLLTFILLGVAFGTDGILKIPFENYRFAEQICSVALIFIMFYGGFGTNWSQARPVAIKSALLSTLGVALTAALTGLFCYFILGMELLESLLIGAVISSTDAASVFAILRSNKMGLRYHTDSMLELESGSNDPCSYMLTVIVLSIMEGKTSAGSILAMVFSQFFFSILVGVLVALIAVWILKRASFSVAGFDMAFVIGVALISYSLAAVLGGNGYLSTYLCGIILGNARFQNKKALVHFFNGITSLMQMLIFFLLGLLATPSRIPQILLPALGVMLFLTLAARPIAVFACLSPFRCRLRQTILVSFAGLRGAASIVFAIMAVAGETTQNNDLFHIVFCIVLLSILFQGSLLSPFARWLGMSDKDIDVMRTFSDYTDETDLHLMKLTIREGHPWAGHAIQDIVLPPDTLMILVIQKDIPMIPHGGTLLHEGDVAVLSAHEYQGGSAISLQEHRILPESKWIGKTVHDFSPKSGELVIMVIRGDQTIIPKGDTVIEENDLLVVNLSGTP